MPPAARRYRAADRGRVLALVGRPESIDSPSHRLHVIEDAGAFGVALWVEPTAGDLPRLGAVLVDPPTRFDLIYLLADACAAEAMARGFVRAQLEIRDRRLLTRLERDFAIATEPSGWAGPARQPAQWTIEVDLADARDQLAAVL